MSPDGNMYENSFITKTLVTVSPLPLYALLLRVVVDQFWIRNYDELSLFVNEYRLCHD